MKTIALFIEHAFHVKLIEPGNTHGHLSRRRHVPDGRTSRSAGPPRGWRGDGANAFATGPCSRTQRRGVGEWLAQVVSGPTATRRA